MANAGLIDPPRVVRLQHLMTTKCDTDLNQNERDYLERQEFEQNDENLITDIRSVLDYRLSNEDVPTVFGGLARIVVDRPDGGRRLIELLVCLSLIVHPAMSYFSLQQANVIADSTIDDLELKLSCLRLLRYIALNCSLTELEQNENMSAWAHLRLHQDNYSLHNVALASLSLIGAAKGDSDIITQALDLTLVLIARNPIVREGLLNR
jgi:hypothetical protein